jgi:hypothetical protein
VARGATATALGLAGSSLMPQWWFGRHAEAWFQGQPQPQAALARGVAGWLTNDLSRQTFSTGSRQFNGEWLFGTFMMAGMGFGQTVLSHPELRAIHLPQMSACIDRMISPEVRAFDRESWKNDAVDSLDGDSAHAAYLGYLNLLLSLNRLLDPQSQHASLNDRVTAALARRVAQSPTRLLETYPGEVYPVDNAAVAASIGLYDRATGADHGALLRDWGARCRRDYLDPATGLLVQAVDPSSGRPIDKPRGSGSCLAQYFLSFSDPALAADLHHAIMKHLAGTLFGFGMVHEYPATVARGRGDIDSGPVILGFGVSATGFCLAGTRQHGDAASFRRLFATGALFGAPLRRGDASQFVTGGPIGDAIMFAMLTAPRELPTTATLTR